MTTEADTLLTFPCDFIIKVFGKNTPEFEIEVLTLIRKNVSTLAENAVRTRASGQDKYLALTITVHVDSKQQLDQIYLDLTASPYVLMAL